MRLGTAFLFIVSLGASAGCATATCETDRECGPAAYCQAGRCRRDCRVNSDCSDGQICDATRRCSDPDGVDAGGLLDGGGQDTGVDGGLPGTDSGVDTGVPVVDTGVDAPTPALGRYLDRCTTDANCMSGRCVDDTGGTRVCTITCSGHGECAAEHVCAAGVCRRDDTGVICSGASGCVLGLCAGNPATGSGECTRPCASASDCPAGYACSDAGGAFVCVNIERGCAQCGTGLCLSSGLGCTSTCRTASDCPAALPGMGYTCSGGQCVPSPVVFGPDPIGAACASSGTTTCRSGACLTDDFGASYCTQRCTESGGCGPGFGCVFDSGAGLICLRGGSGALGSACTGGNQCDSGICAPGGYCTRLCTADARCPSDMRCGTGPGATCVR